MPDVGTDREPCLHGVLVTYERPHDLRRSLAALEDQTRRLDTLVVVDNSSTAGAEPIVRESSAADRVEYVATGANLGPAGGIAVGMTHCLEHAEAGDWICLLDDDDPLPDDRLLADRARYVAVRVPPDVAALGGGGGVLDRRTGLLRPAEPGGDADYLGSGYCPIYRVDAVRSIGVFDSELFFGFDDLDYGMRLTGAGWRLRLVPRPRAWAHPRRPPSRTVGPIDWRRYYSLRNLIYMLRKHGCSRAAVRVSLVNGLAKPVANLPFRPSLAMQHLKLNSRAVRDGWAGRLGMTVPPDAARRVGKV
jgi:GT2 family glycosyltransferase